MLSVVSELVRCHTSSVVGESLLCRSQCPGRRLHILFLLVLTCTSARGCCPEMCQLAAGPPLLQFTPLGLRVLCLKVGGAVSPSGHCHRDLTPEHADHAVLCFPREKTKLNSKKVRKVWWWHPRCLTRDLRVSDGDWICPEKN